MKILVADDEPLALKAMDNVLRRWGYEVDCAADGLAAWNILQQDLSPRLALIDRMMPEMDGLELCRRIRSAPAMQGMYIILLTGMKSTRDIVDGLEAGANDYVTKPFEPDELRVRIAVGVRVLTLQEQLTSHIRELEDALSHVKQLQGLLPICACCKKIRDQENYWHMVEDYIGRHSGAKFTHGYCPECFAKAMAEIEGFATDNSA